MQSRYYNPEIGRFINADDILCTDTSVILHNLFSYCENNPIMGYDPTGHWNWGGFFAGVAIAAVGILTIAAAAATGGAAVPLAVAATKAVVATVGLALTGTGVVTSYAAAAEKTMVVDVATSNGSTHDKTGYSVVVDFDTDSVGIDTYYHYGKTTDGYGVSYGVGLVEGYEDSGDYGGYFADAGAVYSYDGINLGIDVCTDPSVPFSKCSAVMGTFGISFPKAAGGVSVYAGLDYYLPLSYIEWG